MDKLAKSSDPIQQQLRDKKQGWNKAVREFIKRVIAFKKGINGRGDNAFGFAPGSIKDPIPSEVISFLSELTSNFEQLSSAALDISREQADYSEHRRKHIERKPEAITPTPAPEPPKIAATNNGLLKLASRIDRKLNGKEMDTATLRIGKIKVPNVLLAQTAVEQMMGLMYRDEAVPMAFPYHTASTNSFWMKNCPQALDIVFCRANTVVAIHKGEPHSTKLIGGNLLSDLVIEFPYETCERNGIKVGDKISLLIKQQ